MLPARAAMLAGVELPENVVLEDVGCPLGCARDDRVLIAAADRISGVSGRFEIVRCGGCGLARTNPRPTRETIGTYYPDSYAPYEYTKAAVAPRKPRSFVRRIGRRVIEFNSSRIPELAPGHVLELGCASGAYLAHLASLRWTVEGVELNAAAAAAARERGFRVQNCAVEAMQPPSKPPSLIVAWMVLEHLHDPLGALSKLREWATPESWLVGSVPNFSALGAGAFGEDWYALQLPCHLYHYNEDTMRRLLLRAGWKLERVLYQRTLADIVSSVGNLAETRGQEKMATRLHRVAKRRKLHLALYPLASTLAAFGQTGRMTFWARPA